MEVYRKEDLKGQSPRRGARATHARHLLGDRTTLASLLAGLFVSESAVVAHHSTEGFSEDVLVVVRYSNSRRDLAAPFLVATYSPAAAACRLLRAVAFCHTRHAKTGPAATRRTATY